MEKKLYPLPTVDELTLILEAIIPKHIWGVYDFNARSLAQELIWRIESDDKDQENLGRISGEVQEEVGAREEGKKDS